MDEYHFKKNELMLFLFIIVHMGTVMSYIIKAYMAKLMYESYIICIINI